MNSTIDERLVGGRLTVDLYACCANWRMLNDIAKDAETAACVKADAYGLGLAPVAKALFKTGCKTFFVAVPHEGIKLREAVPGAIIYVLNGLFDKAQDIYLAHDLRPVLCSPEDVQSWREFISGKSVSGECALHIDTGMNRLGIAMEDLSSLPESVSPSLVMSHFACADDPANPMNRQQLTAFNDAANRFPEAMRSLANSAGVLAIPESHQHLTRPGIALYGGEAVNSAANPMKPVVTLEGRIAQVRTARAGQTIGYGASHRFERDRKIATISIGYADGFLRAGSGSGVAMRAGAQSPQGAMAAVNGQKVPILGRVSMDLIGVDVSDLEDDILEASEWVELIGDTISVDDVARAAGTIGYEILTGLSHRYSRSYLGG